MPESIADYIPRIDAAKSIADYITLIDATKVIPGRPHLNTVRRWCDRGYSGIVLESWRFANRRVTTVDAIERFMAKTNGVEDPNPRRSVSLAHQKAEAVLDAAGV